MKRSLFIFCVISLILGGAGWRLGKYLFVWQSKKSNDSPILNQNINNNPNQFINSSILIDRKLGTQDRSSGLVLRSPEETRLNQEIQIFKLNNKDNENELYSKYIKRNNLQEKSRAMMQVFTSSEIGHAMALISTFLSFGSSMNTPEGKLVEKQLQFLKNHPLETLDELKKSLPSLGSNYTSEHQFLLQFTEQLILDQSVRFNFLSGEFKRSFLNLERIEANKKSNIDSNLFEGVMALDLMIKQIEDESVIEPVLREVLNLEISRNNKRLLILNYGKRFYNRQKQLMDEFQLQ